jgi:ribokinase
VYDVITIGSATVDVFVKNKKKALKKHGDHQDITFHMGSKLLIEELHYETGGSGTNCGVAFSKLGLKTGWIGVLGDDSNAKHISQVLKENKIKKLGQSKKGPSGFSVILVGQGKDRLILAHKGVNDQLTSSICPRTKWLYCGSMLGKSWKSLVKTVAHAKRRGAKIA